MEDLMRELDVNELEKFAGGKKSKASKAKDAAYCTYWWGLCVSQQQAILMVVVVLKLIVNILKNTVNFCRT
ncbi:hypothetical protein [Staphylococcus felis]|uniref:hypothetical protein n=2 Tax=Staphylococcus felis TaxID=46127 RepID=UPI00131A50A8|nr:hypothetical protein [Staphylococcus felis]